MSLMIYLKTYLIYFQVQSEKLDPGSQDRVVEGKVPHLWGQSLYLLGRLIWDGLLDPDQVDPLKRRFAANPKPDVVVQGNITKIFY